MPMDLIWTPRYSDSVAEKGGSPIWKKGMSSLTYKVVSSLCQKLHGIVAVLINPK